MMGDTLRLSGLGEDRNGKVAIVLAILVAKLDCDDHFSGVRRGNCDAELALDRRPSALALPTTPVASDRLEKSTRRSQSV
jgi:hypothetical protein